MSDEASASSRRSIEGFLLAAFFLELLNLFSIAISHGGLTFLPISGDRFRSFGIHAALGFLFLAAREASRRRLGDAAANHYRLARLALVGVCLIGAAVYFQQGIRLGADGPNYFIQARSLLFDRDLDFDNELERVAGVVPGMPERAMGLPLISIPFLALAHLLLKLGQLAALDLAADGFGYPYETAFGLASYLVGAIGLLAMLRVAFRFFSPPIAFLSVLTVGTSSFLAWYMVLEPAMPHAVSAASVAFAIGFWLSRRPLLASRDWMVLGALLGFATLARWQNVAFVALPFLDSLLGPRRSLLKSTGGAALAFTVTLLPQLAYWNAAAGGPFSVSLERHGVAWTQFSVAEVLYSTNRGLFPWSPVLYLGLLGLLFWLRGATRLASLCLLGFALQVYINSSVEMWYGGWAFGGRRFDGSLVLFVLGFAAFLDFVRQRPLVPLVALSAMLFAWNAGLMRQAARAEIEPDANVSFRQVAVRSLDVYYQRLGFAGAWPANWLFAWRHGVPAEKFDRLFGHRGFGNFRLPMDAGADAFLGRGFGGVERDERGDWFRWSLGNEATVLVPLREPHRYHLSIRVRPYEAIGENGIGLWVNGRVDRRFDLDPLEGTQDLVWDLEPGRFVEGINEIRFDIQRARRPGEETASPDSRPIGVRFYRLELIARGASPDTTDLDVR